MKRQKFEFTPSFEGPIKGWTIKYANNQLWKFGNAYSTEDIIQEAYLTFLICRDMYPSVTQAKHFMALFKRAFTNRMCDIIRSRLAEYNIINQLIENRDLMSFQNPHEYDIGQLYFSIEDSPQELKLVLKELSKLKHTGKIKLNKRVSVNKWLCSLIGADYKKLDIKQMFIDCLVH